MSETTAPEKPKYADPEEVPTGAHTGPETTTSKDALKKRAVHPGVTLPSGAVVTIRVPNLAAMVKTGRIPNDLIDAALKQQSAKELTKEILLETWEYTEQIVPLTLVEPEITPEDVVDLDGNDVEMLAAFASRRTDLDAVGHQLGGLETQRSFRELRDLISLREVVGSD